MEPTKQLIHQRFPKVPVEEIDKSFFRPVLLVMSILTFVQMLGSRESLSLISLGDVFGGLSVGIGFGIKEIISNFKQQPLAAV